MLQLGLDIDDVPPYEHLPKRVKDNIPPEDWPVAEREVVHTSATIPDSGQYINLMTLMPS